MKAVKTILASILALIAIFITIVSSIGCIGSGEGPSSPINIAFVLGIADGETMIDEGIIELSSLPALPGTDYAFISVEGEPACIGEPAVIQDYSDRGYTEVMMERLRSGIRADIASKLKAYTPLSPEIDMASAIDFAVRTVNSHAVDGRENILVFYCSGRSTAGLINMVETPVYKLDVDSSVSAVANKMRADMSEIDKVIWYACGSFGGQSPLNPTEVGQLKSFYNNLFKSLGLKSDIDFRENLAISEYYCFVDAPVSDIDVEGTRSGLVDLPDATEEPMCEPLGITPVNLLEDIYFEADTAVLINRDEALAKLSGVAEQIIASGDTTYLLLGGCAGDTSIDEGSWGVSLSRDRAYVIRDLLHELNVQNKQLIVIGMGSSCLNHVPDLGTGIEGEVNRVCWILRADTPEGMEILQSWLSSN